jgi:hypothetical protein
MLRKVSLAVKPETRENGDAYKQEKGNRIKLRHKTDLQGKIQRGLNRFLSAEIPNEY